MNDITHTLGLLRSEVRDARAIASNLDYKFTRLVEGAGGNGGPRDGSLVIRAIACRLLSHIRHQAAAEVAGSFWPRDLKLRSAVAPAMTTVAGWAAELVGSMVADIADRLLPPSVFSQLRAKGLAYEFTDGGGIPKVPFVSPIASGSFVGEGQPIPARQLLIGTLNLPPKKIGSILAITSELLRGSPASTETSLQAIMGEDLGLMLDNLLLDDVAADEIRPAGLRNGVAALTPSATDTPTEKAIADLNALLVAIAPSPKPILIASPARAVTLSVRAPGLTVPVIAAPFLPADMLIAIDAAAFASVVGPMDAQSSDEPIVTENTEPAAIGSPGTPPVVAAPVRSYWQTDALSLRSILDANWKLRRTGAVSWMSGVEW